MTAFSNATTKSRTPKLQTPQIEQRINHQLARSMIGHLAAAIDLHHGNIAWREQCSRLAFSPKVKTGGCSTNQISSARRISAARR